MDKQGLHAHGLVNIETAKVYQTWCLAYHYHALTHVLTSPMSGPELSLCGLSNKLKKMIVGLMQYILLFVAYSVTATEMLLEDARHLIKGVPYTHQQRVQLAKAARNVLAVFKIN